MEDKKERAGNNPKDKSDRKIIHDNSIFRYEEVPTRYSITKSEQRILIFLVLIISVCLGVEYYKGREQNREIIYSSNILNGKNIPEKDISLKSDNSVSASQTNNEKNTEVKPDALLSANTAADSSPVKLTGKIDLNAASVEELISLKGIGPTKADAVIAWRKEHGYFSKTEDLKNVSGIGDKTYEKIKGDITVIIPKFTPQIKNSESWTTKPVIANLNIVSAQSNSVYQPPMPEAKNNIQAGIQPDINQKKIFHDSDRQAINSPPTPVNLSSGVPVVYGKININTASAEELKKLYRVGDVIAQRIIQYRIQNGGFKSIEELKNVKGIGEIIFMKNKDAITVK